MRFALRALFHVTLFTLVFALAAGALGRLAPWPEEKGLRQKLEYFSEHKDEFDVVFLGSSRVLSGYRPEAFDSVAAERGFPVTSFNFGVPGMTDFEADHVLRTIIALKPARLTHVFLEVPKWELGLDDGGGIFNHRRVNAHTLRQTWNALRAIQRTDEAPLERRNLALGHVRVFSRRATNYGLGPRIAKHWLGWDEADEEPFLTREDLDEHRGFRQERSRRRLKRQERKGGAPNEVTEEMVSAVPARNADRSFLDSYPFDLLTEQAAFIRSRGIEPIYVTIPQVRDPVPEGPGLAELGYLQPFLNFCEPQLYPGLFRPDSYRDYSHLSLSGSRKFSRLLAEAYLDIQRVAPDPDQN